MGQCYSLEAQLSEVLRAMVLGGREVLDLCGVCPLRGCGTRPVCSLCMINAVSASRPSIISDVIYAALHELSQLLYYYLLRKWLME